MFDPLGFVRFGLIYYVLFGWGWVWKSLVWYILVCFDLVEVSFV